MVKKKLLLLLLLLPLWIQAQVVTTVPAFLTEDAAAEIIFDASGTGLDGYSGDDIYAHAGVITDKSTSLSDWKYAPDWLDNSKKYKLVSLGDNKWKLSITPTIHSYYGVATGEKVQKLAFVFRNGDGSKEGKDNGKDIFIDVKAAGLQVVFEKPSSDLLIDINTSVDIKINASEPTTIQLLNGKDVLKKVEGATTLSHSYKFTTEGTFSLIAEAGIAPNAVRESIAVTVKKANTSKPLPAGVRAGINYINDNTVTFVLYAPRKSNVYLIGDFNDWKVDNNYMMNQSGDYWWITLSDLEKGKEYAFQYLVDGSLKIADPYTNKVLDPWNDSYIPSSVYPNLKPYPTDKTDGIVSVIHISPKHNICRRKNFFFAIIRQMFHDNKSFGVSFVDFTSHAFQDIDSRLIVSPTVTGFIGKSFRKIEAEPIYFILFHPETIDTIDQCFCLIRLVIEIVSPTVSTVRRLHIVPRIVCRRAIIRIIPIQTYKR